MTTGRPDIELIRRHLRALDRAVVQLRTHQGKPVEALETDLDLRWSVEHGLQLCAQNVLDVATHVAAVAGRDAPDYATAVDQLGELGILPTELTRRLRGLAGFRNVLVHGYLTVDLGRVHQLLNERLGDFERFAREVESWLARASSVPPG